MSAPISSPTQITIRPDRELMDVARFPKSDTKRVGERHQFGAGFTTADANYFGEDGPGLEDVVDAINPLHHIPIVGSIYSSLTGDTASTVSKLAGGVLLGGPIGFIAALGNVIFEQETGHSVGGAVVAALKGEPAATEVAAADEKRAPASQVAQAEPVPMGIVAANELPASAPIAVAQASNPADADALALFGVDAESAHRSYRAAQFRDYLTDVTQSQVL